MSNEDQPVEIELIPLAPLAEDVARADPAAGTARPSPAAEAPRPITVVIEDEDIYCPVCSYNLTGMHSGRCPECGALFDREALIAAQQANAITLIPWDDPEEMPLRRRLYQTLKVCLVNAERFAFAFSVQPRESRAFSFFAGVTAAASLIGLLALITYDLSARLSADALAGLLDPLAYGCGIGVFIPLTIAATTLLTGAFLWACCPHYDGRRRFKPWLSIAGYAAAHYLMIVIAIPIYFLIPFLVSRSGPFDFIFTAFFIWMACTALCVLTLRAVVFLRSSDSDFRFTVAMVAFIHGGGSILCMYLSSAIGMQIARLIRIL